MSLTVSSDHDVFDDDGAGTNMLANLIRAARKNMAVPRATPCPDCGGSGKKNGKTCGSCAGTGTATDWR